MDALNKNHSFALGVIIGATFCYVVNVVQKKNPRDELDNAEIDEATRNAESGENFISAGRFILSWIVNYRSNTVKDLPVISRAQPNYLVKIVPHIAPEEPQSWKDIFTDVDRILVPGLTNWQSTSKFFAYFKPHASFPAVLGELLCAGLNVMGFDWIASPCCTELEVCVLDWLAKFLGLPETYWNLSPGPGGSVIQGSAGETCIVVILAAIVRYQKQHGVTSRDKMVVYGSDQTHAIVEKACMILGIVHYRQLPTTREFAFGLQAAPLREAIAADLREDLIPLVVVATAGTTSSCAFDAIADIVSVAREVGLWVHVDAAYGGAYACLPELASSFHGLHLVDSLCVNCHKKLLCPFDICAMYVSDRGPILQALSLQPEYLKNAASASGAVVDYEHWQLPLGRRFRALKLWFVFRRFGAKGVREHVRQGVRLCRHVEGLVRANPLFELPVPPSLSLVCFRVKGRPDEDQRLLLDRVRATGQCFIIHTKLGGEVVLRFACGGIEQTEDDVAKGWRVIETEAALLFK